jgi:hypothetical protein
MIRLLPRTSRGTWLLAGPVWLAGWAALWWALPYRPRVSWPTEGPAVVHGFIPGTAVFLTSSPLSGTNGGAPSPIRGPLLARNVSNGDVREWFSENERLTLVDTGVDGRRVLVGRVVGGRARLFLHDAINGGFIAKLPQGEPHAGDEKDPPLEATEQFAAFRPDGRQILYADRVGGRRWLRIWDIDAGREIAGLPDAGPPAAWSAVGRTMAYATRSRDQRPASLHFWDGSTHRARVFHSFEPPAEEFEQLAFSPDGEVLTGVREQQTGGWRCTPLAHVVGWEVRTGREKYRCDGTWAGLPPGLPWFATVELRGEGIAVHRHDYATGTRCGDLGLTGSVGPGWYGFSPDGSLGVGSREHSNPILDFLNEHFPGQAPPRSIVEWPQLVETATDRPAFLLPMALDREGRSRSVRGWSTDGAFLAIAGQDTLAVWDVPPRKSLAWFTAGSGLLAFPIFIYARRRTRNLGLL